MMEYDKAARFWVEKDSRAVKCPDAKDRCEQFIMAHHVCAMAAASKDIVRCTPIEYSYADGAFWMFSEGGLKFAALKENHKVCLAIFESNPSFGGLHSVQVSGTAEIVEPFSKQYMKLLEYKHIPSEMIRRMEEPMNLIKVVPEEADFLDSDLKKEGYGSRQHIVW